MLLSRLFSLSWSRFTLREFPRCLPSLLPRTRPRQPQLRDSSKRRTSTVGKIFHVDDLPTRVDREILNSTATPTAGLSHADETERTLLRFRDFVHRLNSLSDDDLDLTPILDEFSDLSPLLLFATDKTSTFGLAPRAAENLGRRTRELKERDDEEGNDVAGGRRYETLETLLEALARCEIEGSEAKRAVLNFKEKQVLTSGKGGKEEEMFWKLVGKNLGLRASTTRLNEICRNLLESENNVSDPAVTAAAADTGRLLVRFRHLIHQFNSEPDDTKRDRFLAGYPDLLRILVLVTDKGRFGLLPRAIANLMKKKEEGEVPRANHVAVREYDSLGSLLEALTRCEIEGEEAKKAVAAFQQKYVGARTEVIFWGIIGRNAGVRSPENVIRMCREIMMSKEMEVFDAAKTFMVAETELESEASSRVIPENSFPTNVKLEDNIAANESVLYRCEELADALRSTSQLSTRQQVFEQHLDLSVLLRLVTDRKAFFGVSRESVRKRMEKMLVSSHGMDPAVQRQLFLPRQRSARWKNNASGLRGVDSVETLLRTLTDPAIALQDAEDTVIGFIMKYLNPRTERILWRLIDKTLLGPRMARKYVLFRFDGTPSTEKGAQLSSSVEISKHDHPGAQYCTTVSNPAIDDVEKTLLRCEEFAENLLENVKRRERVFDRYSDISNILRLVADPNTMFLVTCHSVLRRTMRYLTIAHGETIDFEKSLAARDRGSREHRVRRVRRVRHEDLTQLLTALGRKEITGFDADDAVLDFVVKYTTPRTEEIFWKLVDKKLITDRYVLPASHDSAEPRFDASSSSSKGGSGFGADREDDLDEVLRIRQMRSSLGGGIQADRNEAGVADDEEPNAERSDELGAVVKCGTDSRDARGGEASEAKTSTENRTTGAAAESNRESKDAKAPVSKVAMEVTIGRPSRPEKDEQEPEPNKKTTTSTTTSTHTLPKIIRQTHRPGDAYPEFFEEITTITQVMKTTTTVEKNTTVVETTPDGRKRRRRRQWRRA